MPMHPLHQLAYQSGTAMSEQNSFPPRLFSASPSALSGSRCSRSVVRSTRPCCPSSSLRGCSCSSPTSLQDASWSLLRYSHCSMRHRKIRATSERTQQPHKQHAVHSHRRMQRHRFSLPFLPVQRGLLHKEIFLRVPSRYFHAVTVAAGSPPFPPSESCRFRASWFHLAQVSLQTRYQQGGQAFTDAEGFNPAMQPWQNPPTVPYTPLVR